MLFRSDERHRKLGYATTLMLAAEAEARRRGCKQVIVDTFSFQAPEFYKKLHYREFGLLNDFPAGHSRHYLTKAL